MHVCMHVCVHIYIYAYLCVCVYVCICVCCVYVFACSVQVSCLPRHKTYWCVYLVYANTCALSVNLHILMATFRCLETLSTVSSMWIRKRSCQETSSCPGEWPLNAHLCRIVARHPLVSGAAVHSGSQKDITVFEAWFRPGVKQPHVGTAAT